MQPLMKWVHLFTASIVSALASTEERPLQRFVSNKNGLKPCVIYNWQSFYFILILDTRVLRFSKAVPTLSLLIPYNCTHKKKVIAWKFFPLSDVLPGPENLVDT